MHRLRETTALGKKTSFLRPECLWFFFRDPVTVLDSDHLRTNNIALQNIPDQARMEASDGDAPFHILSWWKWDLEVLWGPCAMSFWI